MIACSTVRMSIMTTMTKEIETTTMMTGTMMIGEITHGQVEAMSAGVAAAVGPAMDCQDSEGSRRGRRG